MVAKEVATAPIEPAAGDGGESPEANPLAIVPSQDPPMPRRMSAESTRREEVESKISAWEDEEIARITNRFRRQKAIIDGWEVEQVDRANAWLKRVERKLEEKRAKALEKMQNEVAIARQKAEERRAESEAKREERLGKVIEIARVMKIFGRDPSKRSFFKP
ncbi:remorin 4.1-like [Phalaenopsis equestris]|uniref:remorin 4.1-like n=1 Tax=Phalaenopsis equestris TaxID=78828 RepID=UPI0009E51D02|nr:remorin 4.1-like [Phalaenopsis equestris]